MTEDIILKIDKIDVFQGSFQALWKISLEVKRGEIVALVGANTAGKSTLLDTISGLLHPSKGTISFKNRDITCTDAYKIVEMGITQIPEGRRIFPEMTVMANLIIGSYTPRARANQKRNLKRVFDFFPKLEERRNQIAKTLSGGEQQMMAIGRSLMSEPELMLIDEMSLGLAPIIVNDLLNILKEIRQSGVTILFVEQNVRKSIQESDRVYILENGRIVLCGDSCEFREEDKVLKAYFGI
jgi:branched-chain amino acid transport system ATP-binding protein